MMHFHWRKYLLLILACTIPGTGVAKPDFPDFPPPPDSTVGRPAENMVMNGIPMDVRQFVSKRSVSEVLEFYREHWPEGTEEKPGYTETDVLDPWRIITRVEDGYLMTIQVTESGDRGSSGLLAISRLPNPGKLPELGEGFPKLRGSYVMNDILSKDLGKEGRTLQIANDYSVQHNANYYRDHYANYGWGKEMDQSISGGDTRSLRFSNGKSSVTIVIHKTSEGSLITAQTEE